MGESGAVWWRTGGGEGGRDCSRDPSSSVSAIRASHFPRMAGRGNWRVGGRRVGARGGWGGGPGTDGEGGGG